MDVIEFTCKCSQDTAALGTITVVLTQIEIENVAQILLCANPRCRKCRVPESFALATRNCIFEKCTFGEPEEKLPVQSAVNAVIYVEDCVNAPQTSPGRTITAKPAAQLMEKAGATPPYMLNGGRLEFQTPPR